MTWITIFIDNTGRYTMVPEGVIPDEFYSNHCVKISENTFIISNETKE